MWILNKVICECEIFRIFQPDLLETLYRRAMTREISGTSYRIGSSVVGHTRI